MAVAKSIVPDVSFDWLGELPQAFEEGASRKLKKDVFANLKSNDPESLRTAGNRLLASSSAKDNALGIQLHNAAQQREALTQKGVADAAFAAWYARNKPDAAGGVPPNTVGSGYYDPAVGEPASPARPPDPFSGAGSGFPVPPDRRLPTGPGASLPTPEPQPPIAGPPPDARVAALGGGVVPPVPPNGPPPPPLDSSAGVIDQAQAGILPPPPPLPPPVQTAQAGPSGAPPPGLMGGPPGAGSAIMGGMQAPIGPAPAPPQGPPRAPPGSPDQSQAQREADFYRKQLLSMPPGSGKTPAAAALRAGLGNALGRLNIDKDQIQWHLENAQRAADKEPPVTFNDFMNENKTAETRYKSSEEAWKIYKGDETKQRKLLDTLGPMIAAVNHKDFSSGVGTQEILRFKSALIGSVQTLKGLGIDIEKHLPEGWESIKNGTRLQEMFTAVSNQAIFDKLGTLGNQISEGDRNFVNAAFPSLSLTPEGNKLLLEILTKQAQKAIQAGKVASGYMNDKNTRATPWGVHGAVEKWSDENPLFTTKDGKLTQAGQDLVDRGKKLGVDLSPGAPQGAAPAAAPAAPPQAPPTRTYPGFPPGSRPLKPEGGDKPTHMLLPDGTQVPIGDM
jgi:hypothetical protein